MPFNDLQKKALEAKLCHRNVKSREANGNPINYIEGWHAISEANRIFGFDSWDRQSQVPHCHWTELQRGQTVCFYSTKVRITVRAGDTVTVREGIGTGLGRSPNPDLAHEIALKTAETDASKRALATFGNPFGLALYDREQTHVTKPRKRAEQPVETALEPLVLTIDDRSLQFDSQADFVAATLKAIATLPTVDSAYGFWSANLAAFTELRRRLGLVEPDPVEQIIAAIKTRLRDISKVQQMTLSSPTPAATSTAVPITKEKRLRDKPHLAFVAGQPCLVCGRRPSHAHHIKFAQSRSMSLKVSDEYTVPLCNVHHDALHRAGDEKAWWARNGIMEPLKFAARL